MSFYDKFYSENVRKIEEVRFCILTNKKVKEYLPEIGTGYAEATVQQVLNMDLSNNYSEDYSDPFACSFIHETSLGWRLPSKEIPEINQKTHFHKAETTKGVDKKLNQTFTNRKLFVKIKNSCFSSFFYFY